MAVGTTPVTCYEGEDITIVFNTSPVTVTGFVFQFVIKQLATDPDPPLLSGTCNVTGAQQVTVTADVNLDAGSYVYGLRRTDAAAESQYAVAAFTILASPNIAH